MKTEPDATMKEVLVSELDRLRDRLAIVVHRFEVLYGGEVNTSYRLWSSAGELVLRLSPAREAELQVDRRSECAILELAAGAGLAPLVLCCEPERRVLLTRYVAPGAWNREQARCAAGIEAMGLWIARLHRLDPPRDCRVVDIRAVLGGYLETLAARAVGEAVLAPLRLTEARAFRRLGPPRRVALCHNDLHHLNIVGGTRFPRVVDWEYAGAGDPRLDLAQYALAHDLDEAGRAALLDAYASDRQAVPSAEFEAAMEIAAAVNSAWVAVARSGDPAPRQRGPSHPA